MTKLWTFESQEKMKPFLELLKETDIPYELLASGGQKKSDMGLIVAVEEKDMEEARRLLLLNKKRRTYRSNK